jgi:thioredoxin 1
LRWQATVDSSGGSSGTHPLFRCALFGAVIGKTPRPPPPHLEPKILGWRSHAMTELNDDTFDEALEEESLLLVDFWADWCGPCKHLGPMLEELEGEYEGEVRFAKVNADKNRRLVEAFGVKGLPTVLLIRPREGGADVVGHIVGARPAGEFMALIDRGLNPPPSLGERIKGLFSKKG